MCYTSLPTIEYNLQPVFYKYLERNELFMNWNWNIKENKSFKDKC